MGNIPFKVSKSLCLLIHHMFSIKGIPNQGLLMYLQHGKRLDKPDNCTDDV